MFNNLYKVIIPIVVATCLTLVLIEDYNTKVKASPVTGRLDIVDEFYMLDGKKDLNPYGKIIKDRITGICFLFVWSGDRRGGPAITSFDCNQSRNNN